MCLREWLINYALSGFISHSIKLRGLLEYVCAAMDFENFSKKGCLLSFEWGKTNFSTFVPRLEKFGKNPLVALWKKIIPTLMYAALWEYV